MARSLWISLCRSEKRWVNYILEMESKQTTLTAWKIMTKREDQTPWARASKHDSCLLNSSLSCDCQIKHDPWGLPERNPSWCPSRSRQCCLQLFRNDVRNWCRGGFILYRTRVPSKAFQGNAVLDIGGPVHDYAQVRARLPRLRRIEILEFSTAEIQLSGTL